jgi:hypothetical protein
MLWRGYRHVRSLQSERVFELGATGQLSAREDVLERRV